MIYDSYQSDHKASERNAFVNRAKQKHGLCIYLESADGAMTRLLLAAGIDPKRLRPVNHSRDVVASLQRTYSNVEIICNDINEYVGNLLERAKQEISFVWCDFECTTWDKAALSNVVELMDPGSALGVTLSCRNQNTARQQTYLYNLLQTQKALLQVQTVSMYCGKGGVMNMVSALATKKGLERRDDALVGTVVRLHGSSQRDVLVRVVRAEPYLAGRPQEAKYLLRKADGTDLPTQELHLQGTHGLGIAYTPTSDSEKLAFEAQERHRCEQNDVAERGTSWKDGGKRKTNRQCTEAVYCDKNIRKKRGTQKTKNGTQKPTKKNELPRVFYFVPEGFPDGFKRPEGALNTWVAVCTYRAHQYVVCPLKLAMVDETFTIVQGEKSSWVPLKTDVENWGVEQLNNPGSALTDESTLETIVQLEVQPELLTINEEGARACAV